MNADRGQMTAEEREQFRQALLYGEGMAPFRKFRALTRILPSDPRCSLASRGRSSWRRWLRQPKTCSAPSPTAQPRVLDSLSVPVWTSVPLTWATSAPKK